MDQDLTTRRALQLNPERSKSVADRPGLRRYLIVFISALLSLYVLNFHFRQTLAADFFDSELQGKVPVRELGPLWLAVIYAASTLAMMAIVALRPAKARLWLTAVLGGGCVGLLTFGTWNLLNSAWVPGLPLSVVLVDTASHVVVGMMSGAALAYWLPSSRGGT